MKGSFIVTGASGFIGSHFRKKIDKAYNLINIDICRPKDILNNEDWFHFDLSDPFYSRRFWNRINPICGSIKGIVHLAAYYDFTNKKSPLYDKIQNGFETFMEIGHEKLPLNVPIITTTSLSMMKSTTPGNKITPYSPTVCDLDNCLPYIKSKISLENSLKKYKERPCISLSLSGVYSNNCELYLLYQMLERIRLKKWDIIFHSIPKNHGLTYIHIDEVIDIILKSLNHYQGKSGFHKFIVGQDKPVSYDDIYQKANYIFHQKNYPSVRIPKIVAKSGIYLQNLINKNHFFEPWMIDYSQNHYEIDNIKLTKKIGWEQTHYLLNDFDEMLSFALSNPDQWKIINEARNMSRLDKKAIVNT